MEFSHPKEYPVSTPFDVSEKTQPMEKTSAVRVGVRVRPFTAKELSASRSNESVLSCIRDGTQEIRLGSRRFTYDAVFDESVSQEALYQSVAGSLMENVLEGFNTTIMAYGQTGSGKTYTMGSEAHEDTEVSAQTGIIPRFTRDLFANLEKRKEASNPSDTTGPVLTEYNLTASFLEVYGEDVHDLLVPTRPSVPVREDANGGIVCVGLTESPISNAEDALQVLHEGTMHRTTASTLMNLTSSRSHAVFAVTLTQKTAVPTSDEMTTTTTVSRLTFVDLAGSERMKKTGAEGERAREGIKINEGLLALGNVINALADQKNIDEGKKVHVPYRQSKLTRLLQDALGGNSQTLFLACVSPSDTNASESLSTLHYANRARNIRNAPVQNVDASLLELRRLRAWSQTLQNELLRHKFGAKDESEQIGKVNDDILVRTDVQEYLHELHSIALQDNGASQKNKCHPVVSISSAQSNSTMVPTSISANANNIFSPRHPTSVDTDAMEIDTAINQSVLDNFDPTLLTEVNPDHEMAILGQLLELQHRDQAFDDEQKQDNVALEKVEGELAEQENLLLQLRDSLKVYHNIKQKYEILMAEVQQLETEKAQLASQLEKATADPTQGCSSAIRRQLDKVERSLVRARNETKKHRDQYRKLEKEQQKCNVLERKIADLKNGRTAMIKKQKDAAARHREYTEAKTREIVALKRKERNAEKKVSKLQTEVQIHKRNLEKRQQFIQKLNDKLKQTESHLMKLLSTRQRNLQDRMSLIHNRSSIANRPSILPVDAIGFESASSNEVKSAQFLVDRFVSEKVSHFQIEKQYQSRVEEYAAAMKDMVSAVEELRELRNETAPDAQKISDALQAVEEAELKVELIAADVESLRSQMTQKENLADMEAKLSKVVESQSVNVLRTLLIGMLDKQIKCEQCRSDSESDVQKKERTIATLEHEIDMLNRKVAAFASESAKRQDLANGEEDPLTLLARLTDENKSLTAKQKENEEELTRFERKVASLETAISETTTKEEEANQQVAALKAACHRDEHAERALGVLSQVQTISREIGSSTESQENLLRSIENCLEDTCERKLSDVRTTRDALVTSIEATLRRVQVMVESLGLSRNDEQSFPNLRSKQEYWEGVLLAIQPKFEAAQSQARQITDSTKKMESALGLDVGDMPENLQRLVQETANVEKARDLTPKFLSKCEEELSFLRAQKSEIIVQNDVKQNEISRALLEMNITGPGTDQIILDVTREHQAGSPPWWNTKIAQQVCQAVTTHSTIPNVSRDFTDHLTAIHEAVLSVANSRRSLSDKLQGLIERAQQTLLSTVEGGHDAIEACESFRAALLRLPQLSKERINTCLSQISELIPGVDAMIQSEIEALTVVWEALDTPSAERGKFWASIDVRLAEVNQAIFDDILVIYADKHDWLHFTAKQGQDDYSSLDKKLLKLQAVHKEVETLRARQDAKSKVLSLDSEVRLLNAQLSEFEEKKCNKDRLLSRQTASSHLLREERYRKQMKTKFTSKLEQLVELLKVWNEKSSTDFDPNILSEDVQMLIKNASWIEQRKEFMHLRTTKAKKFGKRRIERTGSSESKQSSSPTPRKSSTSSKPSGAPPNSARKTTTDLPNGTADGLTKSMNTSKSIEGKRKAESAQSISKTQFKKRRTVTSDKIRAKDPIPPAPSHSRSVLSQSVTENALSFRRSNIPREDSLNHNSVNKRMTLPPFGHVLEQSQTPRSKSTMQENVFYEK